MRYKTILLGKVGESDLALRLSERNSIADCNMSALLVLDHKQLELCNGDLPHNLDSLIPFGYAHATLQDWLPFVHNAIGIGLL